MKAYYRHFCDFYSLFVLLILNTFLLKGCMVFCGLSKWLSDKEFACNAGDRAPFLGREDPLEEEKATHSSILAKKIPWTVEPGKLQSIGSQITWAWLSTHVWYSLAWSESESEVAQSCPTLCDTVDCSLPGSSVHGILQARILEWVAISFSISSMNSLPNWSPTDGCLGGFSSFGLWTIQQ